MTNSIKIVSSGIEYLIISRIKAFNFRLVLQYDLQNDILKMIFQLTVTFRICSIY
jgi:hypothetical protein